MVQITRALNIDLDQPLLDFIDVDVDQDFLFI